MALFAGLGPQLPPRQAAQPAAAQAAQRAGELPTLSNQNLFGPSSASATPALDFAAGAILGAVETGVDAAGSTLSGATANVFNNLPGLSDTITALGLSMFATSVGGNTSTQVASSQEPSHGQVVEASLENLSAPTFRGVASAQGPQRGGFSLA